MKSPPSLIRIGVAPDLTPPSSVRRSRGELEIVPLDSVVSVVSTAIGREGSIGVIALMVAGAGKLLGGGGFGAVIWVILVACAVIAIISVWNRAHTY